MFWGQYNTMSTMEMETILDKPDVTLAEILDQENVIQECKSKTQKLITFLTSPEILAELISLITTEPPEDADETIRYKLPHVASEILSCEVHQISSAISQDEALLEKLFAFMEQEAPLHPLLASFFSKGVGSILTRKSEQNWVDHQYICVKVIDFLKKKDFVNLALRHIGTSAITDLILRLITCIERGDIRTGILDWLNERELVQSIIKLIIKEHDRDTHDNAARLVIEILRVSRESQYAPPSDRFDDPLLASLESTETMELLLKIIFGLELTNEEDSNETPKEVQCPPCSVISNGISIILALLETRTAVTCFNTQINDVQEFGAEFNSQNNSSEMSSEDAAKQKATLNAILDGIVPWLPKFTDLLVNPPALAPMNTTAGLLDPPLGLTRLHVAKLICALLGTNNQVINSTLRELGTLNILLDLFFKYSLNNFLHAQVKECIRLVFAWNSSVPPSNDDAPKSPSAIRVKTPPTVEMIDPQTEEDKEEVEDKEANVETEHPPSDEEGKEPEKAEESNEANKADGATFEVAYENPLLIDLFTNCRLIERVLEAWEENESDEVKPGFHRKGFMGHLTIIANIMHQNMVNKSQCQELVQQLMSHYPADLLEKWDKFVNEKLAEINERNKIIPPSAYTSIPHSSSDDEDADFKDVHISHESTTVQLFSDYQMQKMSENFVDTFGFSDAAFNDDTDPDLEVNEMTNVLSEEDATSTASDGIKRAQGIFEAICDQRFTSFPGGFGEDNDLNEVKAGDEDDEEDDPWADKTKEISFSKGQQPPNPMENDTHHSSDEDEAAPEAVKPDQAQPSNSKMDVDSEDDDDAEWAQLNHRDKGPNEVIESGSGTAEVAMDTGNPWDSKPLAASTVEPFPNPFESPSPKAEEGWANFADGKAKRAEQDSEMSPAKLDFEAAFEDTSAESSSPQKTENESITPSMQ